METIQLRHDELWDGIFASLGLSSDASLEDMYSAATGNKCVGNPSDGYVVTVKNK